MATLQRFKLLATQCGVAQSPTRSPRTSPLVQLRRRKTTLRMLLSLKSPSRREQPPIHQHSIVAGYTGNYRNSDNSDKDIAGRKLKDLFVSSPPMEEEEEDKEEAERERQKGQTKEEVLAAMAEKLNAAGMSSGLEKEPGSAGPLLFGFRKRLLQKAWRPMLVTIPE